MKLLSFIFALTFFLAGSHSESLAANNGETKKDNNLIIVSALPYNCSGINNPIITEIGSNAITIKASKGSDLLNFADGSYKIDTAPMLLFKPDSNFVFSTCVDIKCMGNYSGGALVIYTNSDNWGKLLFEHSSNGEFAVWTTVTNNLSDDNKNAVIDGATVHLRIAKNGDLFCFYYAADGNEWQLIRSFTLNEKDNIKIGLLAQSPEEDSCGIPFTELVYKNGTFTDFWTGN